MNFSSIFEKAIVKKQYELVNSALDTLKLGEPIFTLNLGYVPIQGIPSLSVVELSQELPEYQSYQLILEVIGDCLIDDQDILDISCGRGGAAFILKTYFHPRKYLGIDISPNAIEFCRQQHGADNILFQQGDAEALRVEDMSFDVVLNIDSSQHYPNILAFYREVHRVLRQDGWFLYCVWLPAKKIDAHLKVITSMGFEVITNVNISPNVLQSCKETAEKYLKIWADNPLLEEKLTGISINNFICSPGSEKYEGFVSGEYEQRIFKFRKVSKKILV
ncbi:class I SAM-dependent methyltransferase [Sphaerospermopsis sp. FACHB-1094]|uniref:class I SAM-dependent methyltransferase n=1 Tax=Sphaerospermopsis sp. FACHB-1094 TaxID=2692861 RepID=UPI0016896911|nr:class I SAM-dependent methyltransferase [Sphaerospermopsis sp. FACHB-1094]MBD2131437.1 class I SAM-dependent methyltransferase [Sphaerospermopsis sp. FACHB-1094]